MELAGWHASGTTIHYEFSTLTECWLKGGFAVIVRQSCHWSLRQRGIPLASFAGLLADRRVRRFAKATERHFIGRALVRYRSSLTRTQPGRRSDAIENAEERFSPDAIRPLSRPLIQFKRAGLFSRLVIPGFSRRLGGRAMARQRKSALDGRELSARSVRRSTGLDLPEDRCAGKFSN